VENLCKKNWANCPGQAFFEDARFAAAGFAADWVFEAGLEAGLGASFSSSSASRAASASFSSRAFDRHLANSFEFLAFDQVHRVDQTFS
jgi:hypothetical protein